ncbi:MAG: hypothetical protein KAS66_03470 [Candidatus Omnitrophica bacterium]|nr:hypothetical protein [Candidatus Omnitrophota bacterium]
MPEPFFEPRIKEARRHPAIFNELRKRLNKKFVQSKLFISEPDAGSSKRWDFLTF